MFKKELDVKVLGNGKLIQLPIFWTMSNVDIFMFSGKILPCWMHSTQPISTDWPEQSAFFMPADLDSRF
jgi:hypothetical protein